MRSIRNLAAGWAMLVLVVGVGLSWAAAPTFQDVEESLTCQCGCGLTVHSCNHLQCGSAIPLRAEIREQLGQGKDKAAILAYFMNKYGEKILSSPTTTGFNMVAWVTPFLAVALGAAFVSVVLVRWRDRRAAQPGGAESPAQPASHTPSPYEKILERELKDFDV